jgi:hypothetical protein
VTPWTALRTPSSVLKDVLRSLTSRSATGEVLG